MKTIPSSELPAPRLELRWYKEENCLFCRYSLVFPIDEYDCRGNDPDGKERKKEISVEIGLTRSSADNPFCNFNGEKRLETPFRDGVHIKRDCLALGGHLPMFVVYKDIAEEIT